MTRYGPSAVRPDRIRPARGPSRPDMARPRPSKGKTQDNNFFVQLEVRGPEITTPKLSCYSQYQLFQQARGELLSWVPDCIIFLLTDIDSRGTVPVGRSNNFSCRDWPCRGRVQPAGPKTGPDPRPYRLRCTVTAAAVTDHDDPVCRGHVTVWAPSRPRNC